MKNYRDLKVWEKAHQITLRVFELSRGFPKEELVGLTALVRKTSASIPAHIVEGCDAQTDADFARFLSAAAGMACELEYQLILAQDLKYLDPSTCREVTDQITDLKRLIGQQLTKIRATR